MNRVLLLLSLLLVPAMASAQEPGDVSRLFSHQAPVTQPGGASFRLPLSTDVLAICRADLSDVRLFGYGGTEIPWMLDSATRNAAEEQLAERTAPVLATPTHTLERSATIPLDYHETYEIAAPGDPPSRGAWTLVIDTTREQFVADVHVTVTTDGVAREIGHGSVYRFLAPLRERLRVPVEDAGADRVRVDVRGHDGFLDPVLTWVATRAVREGEELVVPLEITDRVQSSGGTVITLARPQGILPEVLRFTTTTSAFVRSVHVESGARAIDGTIWRVPGDAGVESLDVRILATQEASIVVRIDDQDSPALADLSIAAVLSRPVLVYFQPAEMLRFGGGRVRAPRYDLAALQGSWAIDQLLDGSTTPSDATLGPIVDSPGWTAEPALAFLHRAGTLVPAGDHAFVAPLEVASAREGASRFVLDAAVLSAAREDLADLRIVDAQGAQWPYLVRETDLLALPVTLGAPTPVGTETRYDVGLPAHLVGAAELRLDPDAPLVTRSIRIVGTDVRGDEQVLTSTALNRYLGGDTGAIATPLSLVRVSTMALFVTDGSETPLAFRSAELRVPTREIVLVAPAGSYRVLVGDDDAAPPTYEIESARNLLDAIPLEDATLGALAPNPAHHEPTFWERNGTSTIALWAVLVLAILVLGALTWRASRMPEPIAAPPEPVALPEKKEPEAGPS